MKYIAIVGTNADVSYNRYLLQFMKNQFAQKAEIELVEVKDYPMFNESIEGVPADIQELSDRIEAADGVIIATPEYDRSVPAALKSLIEWLSFRVHPFTKKPTMVLGASLGATGTMNAQTNLLMILDTPGVDAYIVPGHHYFLPFATTKFDEDFNLKDDNDINWLTECFDNFVTYTNTVNK